VNCLNFCGVVQSSYLFGALKFVKVALISNIIDLSRIIYYNCTIKSLALRYV